MLATSRHLLAIILPVVLTRISCGGEAVGPRDLVSTGQNALGYAGWNGELNSWWDLGTLEVSPNLKIPIRFNFNSAQSNRGGHLLGWNWWFPMLESSVIKESEDHAYLNLLGGEKIDLWKSKSDPRLYRSPDHRWEGRVDDRGNFRAINQLDGITLNFSKGYLKSMALANGDALLWNHDRSGRPMGIKDPKGNHLLRIEYDQDGFPETIFYKGKGQEESKIQTKIENVVFGADLICPALTTLDAPENNVKAFKYEICEPGTILLTAFNQADGAKVQVENFSWNSKDGRLASARGELYRMTETNGATVSLFRTIPNKEVENYTYNKATNVGVLKKDGQTTERLYFMGIGPNFGKTKSITKDGVLQAMFFYDEKGRILREDRPTLDISNIYHYDEDLGSSKVFAEEVGFPKGERHYFYSKNKLLGVGAGRNFRILSELIRSNKR